MKEFPDDTFTEADVLQELERAGLQYKNGSRYILSQCPMPDHEDQHPSTQIYKDDWFVNCHAECGRYHITKAFPELRPDSQGSTSPARSQSPQRRENKAVSEHQYKTFDLMEEWKDKSLIPNHHSIHTVPASILNNIGWRIELDGDYFIPYFSRTKTSIPFAQYRHFKGDRRFTFLKDAKPTMYGTWNLLPGEKLFLVEGTSDCAVLEYSGVPWIGAPSAASGALVKAMAGFCMKNDISIVYAGDNDLAGSKLREALDESMPYRVKQPPTEYKDWGEFLEKTNIDTVRDYCYEELFGKQVGVVDLLEGIEVMKVDDLPPNLFDAP